MGVGAFCRRHTLTRQLSWRLADTGAKAGPPFREPQITITARRHSALESAGIIGGRHIHILNRQDCSPPYATVMKYSVHSTILPSLKTYTATTCEVRVFSGVMK